MRQKSYGKLPGLFIGYYPVFLTLFLLLLGLNFIVILFDYEHLEFGTILLSGLLIFVISLQSYYISRQPINVGDMERGQSINSILYGIIISDSQGKIIDINRVGSEILGIAAESASSVSLIDGLWGLVDRNGNLMHKNDIPISVSLNTCKPVEKEVIGIKNFKFQQPIWLEVSANPVLNADKHIEAVVLVFSEITDQFNSIKLLNEKNEQLRQMSFTDYILNIPNRRYFNSYLTEVWLESKKSGTPVTLYLIEIDYTKEYRRDQEFTYSDHVLMEVSKKLCEAVNGEGVVAHIEGSRFAVIFSGLFGKQIRERQAELRNGLIQLTDENKSASNINDFTVFIGASTRVATDNLDYSILIEEANVELNQAKISSAARM